jgi:hypothetical protein
MKISISIKRKTHDTRAISHPPNVYLQVRNIEDLHQYEDENPWYPDCLMFIIISIFTGRLGTIKISISMKGKTHDTSQYIILPLLKNRLGIMKITISMRRKIHDTPTFHLLPNIDW